MTDKKNPDPMPGVWGCTRREKCTWQCYALHHGLSWGTVPPTADTWRKWHKKRCHGDLVQLIPPEK